MLQSIVGTSQYRECLEFSGNTGNSCDHRSLPVLPKIFSHNDWFPQLTVTYIKVNTHTLNYTNVPTSQNCEYTSLIDVQLYLNQLENSHFCGHRYFVSYEIKCQYSGLCLV